METVPSVAAVVVLSWSRRRRLWARDESRETIRRRHHDAADTCHHHRIHHHSVKNCQPKTKKCFLVLKIYLFLLVKSLASSRELLARSTL